MIYDIDNPKLVPSIVCYVDILGFSQLSRDAMSAGCGNEFLVKIRNALTDAYERVRERAKGWNEIQNYSVKIFTDNIVIGYPLNSSEIDFGESELGDVFSIFSEFQNSLVMEGFLSRGGISFGNHYMDNDIVLGDAFLEAVKLDKNGGAPKISLAPSVVKLLQHHLGFYGDPKYAPQSSDLLHDADGTVFVNYLENAFIAFPDGPIFFDVFKKHKVTVLDGLQKFGGSPDIRSKYVWAAVYHNFVCEDFVARNPVTSNPEADEIYAYAAEEAQKLREFKIDLESLTPQPSRLTLPPIYPT